MSPEKVRAIDQIAILKSVWPDECELIGDYQLAQIAAGEVTITRPEGGFNFDVVPFVQAITAALSCLAAFASYREKRTTRDSAAKKDEVRDMVRYVLDSSPPAELDDDTVTRLAEAYLRACEKAGRR